MKTKWITLLLAILTSIGTIFASNTQVNGIWYDFDSSTKNASVTYRGSSYYAYSNVYSGDVTIPSSVTYNNVEYSVTSIGDWAFADCYGLTSVTIPNSVIYIGDCAFQECSSLTSIVVESGNTIYDSRDNCNAIIETATNTLIAGCKNTIIPNGVTSIGSSAFSGCRGLTSVEIPNSVTSIGEGAFLNCSGLTSVTIPNSVTSIGESAFGGCSSLTSVAIGNGVTSIGNSAFYGCISLTSVTIGNSVTSIGDYAFFSCSSLTSVVIPNSVTSIGNGAFISCSMLNLVYCELGVPLSIIGGTFDGASPTIFIPNCSFAAFSAAPVWKDLALAPVSVNLAVVNNVGGLVNETCGSMEIEAIPYIGYHFKRWQDGNKDNPRKYTLMQTNRNFIAEFEIDKYQITLLCDAVQGSITGDKGKFNFDTEHTIEAVANYGYHFTQWSDGETENPRTFTLEQDTSFTALFAPNKYMLSIQYDDTYGEVEGEQGEFDYLTEHEIHAIPNTGYLFAGWSDGVTDNPRTITLTSDTSITANFEYNLHEVNLLCNEAQGEVSKDGSEYHMSTCIITATPNYGYHFTQWSDGVTDNPREFIVTQDTTFTAEFDYDRTGTCGKDYLLSWVYEPEAQVLTINGEGSFDENMECGIEARTAVKEVVFGEGVTTIGANAFSDCSTIQKLTLSATVKKINGNAFYNCENLTTIYNYRPTPTNALSTAFDGVDKFECVLYVPQSSLDLYKNAAVWRDFYYIYAISETPTGVENAQSDNIQSTKIFRNGQILILRGEKIYTVTGQEVK